MPVFPKKKLNKFFKCCEKGVKPKSILRYVRQKKLLLFKLKLLDYYILLYTILYYYIKTTTDYYILKKDLLNSQFRYYTTKFKLFFSLRTPFPTAM